jgi:hypothetical protein
MAAPPGCALGDADKRTRRSLKRKLASATRRPTQSLPWNATVTSCSAPSSRNWHGVVWPSYPGAAVDLALALLAGVAGTAGLIGDGGAVRHGWEIGEDLVEELLAEVRPGNHRLHGCHGTTSSFLREHLHGGPGGRGRRMGNELGNDLTGGGPHFVDSYSEQNNATREKPNAVMTFGRNHLLEVL